MLTDLDAELFPDDCEVVDIPLHNRRIFLIHKNGSSSLRLEAKKNNLRILTNQDIRALDFIDVYLREPEQRYLSGVNTFVEHLMRDIKGLDKSTCQKLATRYHFLNRHYLPQWHHLVNLARFIDPDCLIRLHTLEDLRHVTDERSRAGILPLTQAQASTILPSDQKLELWFLLDRILIGLCGQALTWKDIICIFQAHPVRPLQLIANRMEAVRNVLC